MSAATSPCRRCKYVASQEARMIFLSGVSDAMNSRYYDAVKAGRTEVATELREITEEYMALAGAARRLAAAYRDEMTHDTGCTEARP